MKLYKLLVVMAFLSMTSIFGQDTEDCCTPCIASCNTCSCSPCCCEPCDFVPPCPPETCAYNAPVIIEIKCGWDIFVTGSFVYFQAIEENLEFGQFSYVTENPPVGNVTTTNTVNEYSTICFDYEPAFKVGFGFNFGCDNWFFYTEYFRYHANAGSGSIAAEDSNGTTVNATAYLLPGTIENVTSVSANAKWRLEMDTVDFVLSRRYYVGKCLVFAPYGGMRTAWIDQTYKVNYHAIFPVPEITDGIADSQADVNLTSCSWAIGAKAGLHADWNFCGCFYFFTDSSFDVLYTDYQMKEHQEIFNTIEVLGTITDVQNIKKDGKKDNKFCFLRPHLQIGLGFGWGDYFCCNDWYFDLKLGYEFHVYWNQNVLPMIPDGNQDPSRLYGDLNLHGLVLTARLDF